MKPEMILQSNLLDIIFENRNKEYGAYTLRAGYNSRLYKAMFFTLCLLFFFAILHLTRKVKPEVFIPQNDLILTTHVILPPLETIKPKETLPVKATSSKNVAKVSNTTISIVPDEMADKEVKTLKELEAAVIGVADIKGLDYTDGPPLLPASEGGGKDLGNAIKEPEPVKEILPLLYADEMPEFPGGKDAFMKFMLRHLRQPEDMEHGEKIVVKVKFVVDADGAIKALQILQSGGKLDAEVMRVVAKMPRWKPGKQNGQFVPVYFQLPVTFVGLD